MGEFRLDFARSNEWKEIQGDLKMIPMLRFPEIRFQLPEVRLPCTYQN